MLDVHFLMGSTLSLGLEGRAMPPKQVPLSHVDSRVLAVHVDVMKILEPLPLTLPMGSLSS